MLFNVFNSFYDCALTAILCSSHSLWTRKNRHKHVLFKKQQLKIICLSLQFV